MDVLLAIVRIWCLIMDMDVAMTVVYADVKRVGVLPFYVAVCVPMDNGTIMKNEMYSAAEVKPRNFSMAFAHAQIPVVVIKNENPIECPGVETRVRCCRRRLLNAIRWEFQLCVGSVESSLEIEVSHMIGCQAAKQACSKFVGLRILRERCPSVVR